MYEYPPIPPTNWLLMLKCSLPILLGLAVLWWTRRRSTFIDPYLWAILSSGIFAAYSSAHRGMYPVPLLTKEFQWLLGAAIPFGIVCAILRMQQKTFERFLSSLVASAVIALVVVFLWPSISSTRNAARRSTCKNNLKQLGLAIHNYHDLYGAYPAPASGDVSWRVAILPGIDQAPLFQDYDQSLPWDSPANSLHSGQHIPVFECPSRIHTSSQTEQGRSDLALPIGQGGLFETETSHPRLLNIPDGASLTLAIVEASGQGIIWNEPRDVNFDKLPIGINLPGSQPGWSDGVLSSYHAGGAQATFADGSVRFLSQNVDPQILKSLLLTNDGGPDESGW